MNIYLWPPSMPAGFMYCFFSSLPFLKSIFCICIKTHWCLSPFFFVAICFMCLDSFWQQRFFRVCVFHILSLRWKDIFMYLACVAVWKYVLTDEVASPIYSSIKTWTNTLYMLFIRRDHLLKYLPAFPDLSQNRWSSLSLECYYFIFITLSRRISNST